MAIHKPSIPSGTRDFTPSEMVRRDYIFNTIRNTFQLFGYQSLETPSMENLSTLLGKYGEEGDKLLFRILNSGDFLQGIPPDKLPNLSSGNDVDYRSLAPFLAEKGLRYDLTVPFARFVVQHQHELTFPFKRYQIQPVWRADRPQKGRYREFYQCDVDVIGSDSLLNELELVQIIDDIFTRFGLNVSIRLNNRKILAGIAEAIGFPGQLTGITVAIDKIDKIGIDKVNQELRQRGISEDGILKLQPVLNLVGNTRKKFELLHSMLVHSETGKNGLAEMQKVFDLISEVKIQNQVDFDLRLARGLSYYTGTILEVKALDVNMGSICGGGRYDNLTGIFGLPGMSGVGISFGADRIYDVMNELKLFPDTLLSSVKVLFLNFGETEEKFALKLLASFRNSGIFSEIYPDQAKIKKQMEYANRKNIPFVVLAGKDEIDKGVITIKNMQTGIQQTGKPEDIIKLAQC